MNPVDLSLASLMRPDAARNRPADPRLSPQSASPEFARILAETAEVAAAQQVLDISEPDSESASPSGEDQLSALFEMNNLASSFGTTAALHGSGSPTYAGIMERLLGARGALPAAPQIAAAGPTIPDQNVQTSPPAGFSQNRFVEWMDSHALTRSAHHCAMFVRRALEAAGLGTAGRPQSGDAGDFGGYLLGHGARVVSTGESYMPQPGDTAVFAKTDQHPHGHIEVFDGAAWVSDFRQRSFSPYRDIESTPPVTVYRIS